MAFRSEILIKLDKKGRALLPAAFRDELPADDRGAFVLYHSPNVPGVVNGNSRPGSTACWSACASKRSAPRAALKVALDDEAFDPAGYLSAAPAPFRSSPMAASPCRPNSPQALEADDGVMLVGKGDKFQLWNPKRWQARRDADREQDGSLRARPLGR